MENSQNPAKNTQHTLNIENKKLLTATGIEGVRDFSPSQFTLVYAGGRIAVGGSDMKITAFSKQTGSFAASGQFTSVKYIAAGEGLRKKLLK